MKNKVFLFSFIVAVILNTLFFKAFHIKGPKVISIMESEVYLLDNIDQYDDGGEEISDGKSAPKITPFFSLPGIYQKVYSRDMNYSINALKEEAAIKEYNPFQDDRKIFVANMDFEPSIKNLEDPVLTKQESDEKRCIDKWLQGEQKEGRLEITKDIVHYFDEKILNEELLNTEIDFRGAMTFQVVFFNKRSFSIIIDDPEVEKTDRSRITQIFYKAYIRNDIVPDKLLGKIRQRKE